MENAVALENQHAGTPDWILTNPAAAGEIEGYASATSVDSGESIALFVSTAAPAWHLEVFRMGWYQGTGARRVLGPTALKGRKQVIPSMDPTTGLIDCNWINPLVLQTADSGESRGWLSGVYLAKLTESDRGKQSYIIFVVRDDERHSDLLVQQSVTTYQAYNPWGGKSLYKWSSTENKRAAKVSFNRPYAANPQNPGAAYGVGAGEFLTNLQPHPDRYGASNAGWEYNMVRWLEREGYDVTYCTNLDTHRRPEALLRHRAWLSLGHDEYWSRPMRDHVEAARDAGVHLGFFGANAAYWQVRFETSPASGTADRVMVCYKSATRDPHSRDSASLQMVTDKWRNEPPNRPEAALVGVMYAADPVDGDMVISAPDHWVFAGTQLREGETLPGLLGYEVDCAHTSSPSNLQILAASPWTKLDDPSRRGTAHMTLYRAASDAMVFATGSMQWSWGLDDYNAPTLRMSRLSRAAQRITRNVLDRFLSVQP